MQNNIFTKTRWLVTIILLLSLAIPMAWGQASTYTSNVTLSTSGGTNASTCTVIISGNNYDGIKIGTSKKSGAMQFSIPSGTTTVYVHVAAWNGESGSMTVSTSVGSITTGSSLSLTADAGINSSSPFTLSTPANASTSYFFTITLSGVNSAATITLSYSKRAVIWGINTVAASCSTNPSVGNASLNGTFNMTSTTSAIGVASGTCGAGTNCSWADYGFVWSDGANTTTPTVGGTNCNKVQVGTSGTATSWTGSVQPSGSTSPTSWTTGHTYYVRTYGKNSKASATYYYSTTAYTFTPQSVTFKANGGTGSDKVQYMRKSTSTALTANTFTRSGYSFAGWATSSSGSVAYTDEQSVSIDADLVLHAKWSPEDYTITLNNQSATTAGSTSISVTFDASTNLSSTPAITVPEKTDYIFGGYYTETDGGGTQIIDANGDVVASASDASYTYTDASKNWKYPNNITLYAKWTEHTYTNYRTNCCTKAMLTFSEDEYADQIRQDLHGNVGSENKFELEIPFSTSSTGTSYTTEIKKLSYGSRDESAAGSACADETAASVNSSAKKVTFQAWSTNPGSNFKGQGTYRIKLIQAADGDYCQGVDYVFVDVVMRDKFVDNVNGNTTINRDGTGTAVQTPAEASLPETDECHETTRRLLGWIKETDLETWYGSTNRVRDLDDKKNDSKIVAPNTDVKTSAVTWYAVWGEEVAP